MYETFTLINYNQDEFVSAAGSNLEQTLAVVENGRYTWLTVHQNNEIQTDVERILAFFNIDTSLREHVLDESPSREFIEADDYLFVRAAIPVFDLTENHYHYDYSSIILTRDTLLVFDQNQSEFMSTVYEAVTNGSHVRQHGPDFLFYLLVRTVVAQSKQFMFVDLNDQLEVAEDEVNNNPGEEFVLDNIMRLRQSIRPLYDFVYQLRASIKVILEGETPIITPHTRGLIDRYLEKDSQELWEGYLLLREGVASLMNIHRANVAEKTNRIIHILTVVSFIFLPITFITSLYPTFRT